MEIIKELVDLSQQLSALMDDADFGDVYVSDVSVDHKGRARVHVSPEMFYQSFKGFKIKSVKDERYFKFRISKIIQGVEFYTFTNDLNGLRQLRVVKRNGIKKEHKKSLRALACE